MFLVIKLLLLVLLFNLGKPLSIKKRVEKNKPEVTTEKLDSDTYWVPPDDDSFFSQLQPRQHNNNDHYYKTSTTAPEADYNVAKRVDKNKTEVTTEKLDSDTYWVPPDDDSLISQLQPRQHNNNDHYYKTSTNAPEADYNVAEFSPETETAMILEELSQYPDGTPYPNGTTNVVYSDDIFATPSISTQKEEADPEELPQLAKPLVTTNTTGIVNYNKMTLPKCPNRLSGLTYMDGQQSNYSVCYLVTEPTSFPPQCPYPNTFEYHHIAWFIKITDEKHWAFTNRNVSDIGKKNCYVTNGAKLVPTSCTDKYPGVCAYSYDMHLSGQNDPISKTAFQLYCTTRYNTSCVSNDIESPSTCYCRSNTEMENLPRTAFCKKLVEITNPYQNIVLEKLLGNHERCWIGLQKNRDSYQWSSTSTTSNYTFWSNNTDFDKTYGALGPDGWTLEEDGALNCAICEISNEDHPQVQLHIEHNKTTNTLDVEITNATGAFQEVTCFALNSDNHKEIDLSDNKHNFLVVKLEFPFITSGYYWCKALQLPNLTPVYSNTIFIAINAGHEYTLLITLPQPDISLPEETDDLACESVKGPLNQAIVASNPVKIIKRNEEEKTLEVLCHITIKPTQASRTNELDMMSNILKNATARITNLASIEACLPSVSISGGQTLHWPETPVGGTTIPEELCLQVDGSPVTRTCTGNFYYGSQWLDVNGTCADVTYSPRTNLLDGLIKSNTTTLDKLSTAILNITQYTDNFTSFEIHLVSKALEKLRTFSEHVSVSVITNTINNIMHFESNKLRVSQKTLNSTDMILYSLDEMLARAKIDDSGYTSEVTEKLVVQISDLKKTNVSGIKLGKTQNGFDSTKINSLQQGTSLDDLLRGNFELAMLIPPELHKDILNCVGEQASPNLITTVFYDDALFNPQNTTSDDSDGRIIGVTIPGFNCTFTTPLQIIFNPSSINNASLKCASWLYGYNDVMESIHGEWFIEGDPKTVGNSSYQICEFRHITHFTLLVLGGNNEISEGHKKALDIITAVGSGLSILGLLMVFLTAIVFKSFRSANAVVIHFSIAMTAQIVLLFVADNVAENKVLCTVFGAALHYIVLAQFCWMLTIAILQYRRYVVVFAGPSPHLIAITCACSWGIPLIPVIIIVSISRGNYGENAYGLCYALGNYFIFGVLIPVSLIIFINLIVFLRIMLSIASSRKITVHQKRDDTSSLQLRLAIMLYFLLGLTWGFGLLAATGGGIAYSYLFCITATLQGFILFLYFIVLNEKTRSLWTNMKTCHCKGASDEYDVNTESAATAMIRRPKNTASLDTNTSSATSEILRKYKNRSSSDF